MYRTGCVSDNAPFGRAAPLFWGLAFIIAILANFVNRYLKKVFFVCRVCERFFDAEMRKNIHKYGI